MEVAIMTGERQKQLKLDRFPTLARMLERIDQEQLEMETHNCENGMEFRFRNEVNGLPNRAWLRVYFPSDAKCMLFFHKKSSVPYSRDRFSYGGVVIDERSTTRFEEEDIAQWIQYLRNGLIPKNRPRSLKKSLPFTVPEN